MKKEAIILCAVLSLLPSFGLFAAESNRHASDACDKWGGKYSGHIPEDKNLSGTDEKVFVFIDKKRGILVDIQGGDGGSFDASSKKFRCSTYEVSSKLDSGFGGSGMVTIRRKGRDMYLRMYGFVEGSGPNRSLYLPFESTEVEIK